MKLAKVKILFVIFTLGSAFGQGNDLSGVPAFPNTDEDGFTTVLACGKVADGEKPHTIVSVKESNGGLIQLKLRYTEKGIKVNIPLTRATLSETSADFSLVNPKANSYSIELNDGVNVTFDETSWTDYFVDSMSIPTRLLNDNLHIDGITFTQTEPSSLWIRGYHPNDGRSNKIIEGCHYVSKNYISQLSSNKKSATDSSISDSMLRKDSDSSESKPVSGDNTGQKVTPF